MSSLSIGIIGILVMLFLLFLRMPVGLAMAAVGFGGYACLTSLEGAFGILRSVPFVTALSYDLSVLPLFLLMGSFAIYAGMTEGLYFSAYKWIGSLPGGLAIATIIGCSGFAAVSGSTLATAATIGKIALPEMKKYRYDPALAMGAAASGGSLGILIPPSSIMIIYGIITEQSIEKLFIAGIFPGILLSFLFVMYILIISGLKKELGPPAEKAPLNEKIKSLRDCWGVIVLFLVIMGGMYTGIFTPTEAAGVGAFGTLAFAVAKRRLKRTDFINALTETISTTGMIFVIIIGAMIFGYFLAISRLPYELGGFVCSLPVSRYFILACILAVYIMLGCVLDTIAMVLITVPVFFPVIQELGFDPIWFGIIMVLVSEMSVITPPMGMNVYVIHGIFQDVPMVTIFRGVTPFFGMMILCTILLILFPEIVLFLPDIMKN
ncbi:MAG: TRAP transporter large permease [Deltaproteobacteria bacterium]|nr:TRAP transporter large permease [Deltaproteobacteria bacterium]